MDTIAARYRISRASFGVWLRKYRSEGIEGFEKRKNRHYSKANSIENYIHFYNTRRYQKRLGSMSPYEFYFTTAA